ncbi:thiosulfate sulfurtransferase SseB [Rhodoferax lithotrophicus]|uniref:Thiosulfate sulfurtransferase SseB n=1 Tax=Rhodoferax lithotrophicus TaxID=2798804 RepID=A0ABM7MJQ2_9BURK|nr:sulfurtransferase [Rhodoferax sp. MIZ03]BCO26479.1 thiosulfate sulfurtransferase SseB [Rhodoferax sp. MIZ03]
MYTTLISVDQLQTLQTSGQPCMVFDCSFELMNPAAGDAQYAQAHIPGAVRADLDRHLSVHGAPDAASGGRHPLPSREAFAAWLGSVGLTPDTQAVVYDRQGVNYSGRLWWMLKWAGHEAVAVLDGGWQAWQAAGGPVESGAAENHPVHEQNYPLAPAQCALTATETIVKELGHPSQTILDARATPRFKGEVEPLDPVAGHIPGALNRPFALNLDANGFFKPAAQLRAEFDALLAGRDPATVVHHCGSGVSAVPNLIAMEVAGLGRTALYAGSWSAWCSDPSRPVAQG